MRAVIPSRPLSTNVFCFGLGDFFVFVRDLGKCSLLVFKFLQLEILQLLPRLVGFFDNPLQERGPLFGCCVVVELGEHRESLLIAHGARLEDVPVNRVHGA